MTKPQKLQIRNSTAEFLIFSRQAGENTIEVRVEDETVWLTQKLIGVLFEKGRSTITEHLKNIFETGELDEKAVCREFRHTAEDGKEYSTRFYSLDAIISVGYRVNSARATQFRQWATGVLRNIPMTMEDWASKLNAFLQFNERDILDNPGKVTQEIAKSFAESEFEKFRVVQDQLFESDFDKQIRLLLKK